MKNGACRSLASAMPGEGEAVVLSGHCNTFFSTLGELKPGGEVTLDTYYGTYVYQAQRSFLFDMDDSGKKQVRRATS